MKTPKNRPAAKTGAESAEVRKASNHAGSGTVGKCGKSAEKVRNPSILSEALTAFPEPAPGLVHACAGNRREVSPAAPHLTGARNPKKGVDAALVETTGGHWLARGTRAALIAAGLCTPAHFPLGRKRVAHEHEDTGRFWSLKLEGGGLWRLDVWLTAEERERAAAQKKEAERLERLRAVAGQSEEAFRSNVHRAADGFLAIVRQAAAGELYEGTPYSFSDSDLAAFDALARRLAVLIDSSELVRQPVHPDVLYGRPDDLARPPRLRAPLRLVKGPTGAAHPGLR